MAHSRNREDLDQLITDTHTAAADRGRAVVVVSPTPQPPHTAERGWTITRYNPDRLTTTPMPRDAVLIIDNAAAARPADLARIAEHAAAHHARLLLVDDDQPDPPVGSSTDSTCPGPPTNTTSTSRPRRTHHR